jgi:rhodanese-related sulfurtransferase|tara:strand:+ start:2180 stop:2569 length:390 start_codon:yes stop_codon:yes gene_type:complete
MADDPESIDVQTLNKMISERQVLLIDVREADEYEEEHVPGALLYPMSYLDGDYLPQITETKIVVMCGTGQRSFAGAKQLMNEGLSGVLNLEGGIEAWKKAGLETEGAPPEDDFPEPEDATLENDIPEPE